ncbi:hypothetical protein C5B42_02255 [Candidatus Cerribacteria bacterium 'Amazon FNV 2010 28 9']|uniref:Uncharacterized protein n=1 Tax=Candidatus Cerribacteria bacterium 'Amazon FNV 2010 28 9' TaxID=2081795 RepID=A0A317JQH4_9BACT|nr:MAG: hypothetical protein C5B42_02255 [Candidatus Cerribacteria bacterium 'Amazon FNV 2010 28 9']
MVEHSFAPQLDSFYEQLQEVITQPTELRIVAQLLCAFIGDFWKSQSLVRRIEPGSFGRNDEGIEQPATCMTINDETETSILKWGYEIDNVGNKNPKIDIFAIPYLLEKTDWGGTQSDHQYSLQITRNEFRIERTNFIPAKQREKAVSIPIESPFV